MLSIHRRAHSHLSLATILQAKGAIRFLLSNDPRALTIRDRTVVKIFPMADPDGVAHGGVRFNRNGYDLNRNWDVIDPVIMPEITAQRRAILDWVDRGGRLDLFLSLHNTEKSEYLECPRLYRAVGEKLLKLLKETTTFDPTSDLRDQGEQATVAQGVFHDRKVPGMLMEQKIEYNSKLGRCATIADRLNFGGELVRAIREALP